MKGQGLQTFAGSSGAVVRRLLLHSYALLREKSYTEGLNREKAANIIKHTLFTFQTRPLRTDPAGLPLRRQLLKMNSLS